jgi:hypothetical protein
MTQLHVPPDLARQLDGLKPTCTARLQTLAYKFCGRPASWMVEVHATNNCKSPELSTDGGIVETVCTGCLATARCVLTQYAQRNAHIAAMFGVTPCCITCGRPQITLESLLTVRPIGHVL